MSADNAVQGIASVRELTLTAEDLAEGGEPISGPCVYYWLLAVDSRYQAGSNVVRLLVDEVDAIGARWYAARSDLIGEVASPTRGTPGLQRYLRRNGFTPLPNDSDLWFRPRLGYPAAGTRTKEGG